VIFCRTCHISRVAQPRLRLRTRIVSLDNHLLATREDSVSVAANSVVTLPPLDLQPLLVREAGPGCRESRRIEVLCPAGAGRCARVALRGWNAQAQEIAVEPATP
jgi:hypothetical protein